MVGLPDNAVKESQHRISSALKNVGFKMPGMKIVVNMAPADIRKEGSAYDLTLAIGILAASGEINNQNVSDYIIMGELSLDGGLQPIKGALPIAIQARKEGIKGFSSAPFGSASILLISYGYIKMLGPDGLTNATKYAIVNGNYIKARLEGAYPILYSGENGRAAHEMIVDLRQFKAAGVSAEDVAKRLMDYGFHAPTLSFPVAGTIMIEPTESEDKAELDRFCDALLEIRKEIDQVAAGEMDVHSNVLSNAPHTARVISSDEWTYGYSRQKAAYPLPYLVDGFKFWPSVARVDSAFGDRNLVCVCPPIEEYMK